MHTCLHDRFVQAYCAPAGIKNEFPRVAMKRLWVHVNGVDLKLDTHTSLFSPSHPDPGTLALLSQVPLHADDQVLDLGCGYGLIGTYAARSIGAERVLLADIDPIAVRLAHHNLILNGCGHGSVIRSDGFTHIDRAGFSKILCNPPYHSDFSTAKHFIEKGFNRLRLGGEMWLVTRRRTWYERKLQRTFGSVRVTETASYFIFRATRSSWTYAGKRGAQT